jgi:hypothetical protein
MIARPVEGCLCEGPLGVPPVLYVGSREWVGKEGRTGAGPWTALGDSMDSALLRCLLVACFLLLLRACFWDTIGHYPYIRLRYPASPCAARNPGQGSPPSQAPISVFRFHSPPTPNTLLSVETNGRPGKARVSWLGPGGIPGGFTLVRSASDPR